MNYLVLKMMRELEFRHRMLDTHFSCSYTTSKACLCLSSSIGTVEGVLDILRFLLEDIEKVQM